MATTAGKSSNIPNGNNNIDPKKRTQATDQSSDTDYHSAEWPVIIVGAGPVGLMLALQLAQSGIRSIVLEKDTCLNDAPRAIGYYGPIHRVFEEIGLYAQISQDGMACGGYVWRTLPTDEEVDGEPVRKLGKIIGTNNMGLRNSDGSFQLGNYTIQLAQSKLSKLLLDAAKKTGFSQVLWGHQVSALQQDDTGVDVSVVSKQGINKTFRAQFLVGCDGARSTVRKLLGVPLHGHSWPERFLATDVLRVAPVVPDVPIHFVVDPRYWGVVTPLEPVEAGKPGLWRYSMAIPANPDDSKGDADRATTLTDAQVMEPEYVRSMLRRQIDGPLDGDFQVVRKSLYKMHQLVASTMHKGRCFLAGDSAHINNPIGGLGLCTGLLDADALHQTFTIAFASLQSNAAGMNGTNGASHQSAGDDHDKKTSAMRELPKGKSVDLQALFSRYSMERRRVFQYVIHPISSANKLRLHSGSPENVAKEDWYLGALRRGDAKELKAIHSPLYESWRTNMWEFQSSWLRDNLE